MSSSSSAGCAQTDLAFAYALHALPSLEVSLFEVHLSGCTSCLRELETLRPLVARLVDWPTDVLRPSPRLWDRLAQRIAAETGGAPAIPAPSSGWVEPKWQEVAPGISCKLLAVDPLRERVSMLVRLAPGAAYPPHRHAAGEELHLLAGELWIDERRLEAGDYYAAGPGTADERIWTETGCTCALITSTSDVLH